MVVGPTHPNRPPPTVFGHHEGVITHSCRG